MTSGFEQAIRLKLLLGHALVLTAVPFR